MSLEISQKPGRDLIYHYYCDDKQKETLNLNVKIFLDSISSTEQLNNPIIFSNFERFTPIQQRKHLIKQIEELTSVIFGSEEEQQEALDFFHYKLLKNSHCKTTADFIQEEERSFEESFQSLEKFLQKIVDQRLLTKEINERRNYYNQSLNEAEMHILESLAPISTEDCTTCLDIIEKSTPSTDERRTLKEKAIEELEALQSYLGNRENSPIPNLEAVFSPKIVNLCSENIDYQTYQLRLTKQLSQESFEKKRYLEKKITKLNPVEEPSEEVPNATPSLLQSFWNHLTTLILSIWNRIAQCFSFLRAPTETEN